MDQRSDYIRQDIESTRASLDEKLDTLESKARQAFDLKYQVSERPWMALGAAVAAGYVLGSLGNDEDQPRWHGQPVTANDYNRHDSTASYNQHTSPAASQQSRGDSFLSQFDDEIDMLKMAAVGALTTFLRDTIREYVPALGQQLDKTMHDRGMSPSPYAAQNRSLTPSTAPNASMTAGAGRAGFDSAPETTYSSSNMAASAAEHATPYYPPGSSGNAERDYTKTYHAPAETNRERAVGEDTGRR